MTESNSATVRSVTATVKELVIENRRVTQGIAKQLDIEEIWFEDSWYKAKSLVTYPYSREEKLDIVFGKIQDMPPMTDHAQLYADHNLNSDGSKWADEYLDSITYREFQELPSTWELKRELDEKWESDNRQRIAREKLSTPPKQGYADELTRLFDAAMADEITAVRDNLQKKNREQIEELYEVWGRVELNFPKSRSSYNDQAQFIGVRKNDSALIILCASHTTIQKELPYLMGLDKIVLGGL